MAVVGWAGAVNAETAVGPICDQGARVGSTTYYSCNGASHNALDMSNGTCSEWNHRGMINVSKYYRYYGGCANTCSGSSCNGGAGNYYVVSGSNGWEFRQLHVNANGSSGSKTCDRCPLGLVGSTGQSTGAHVHADNRQYGTRKTAWYTSVGTTCGSSAYCGNRVGTPTLQ
ncbi:peptidase M23 [Pendulispora brunnea]|uniref:Peptidase M23 n=1 Tax=Pendulispora brunnea TaxID=2905690 RepID=A0ABZ2K2W2_9BACT